MKILTYDLFISLISRSLGEQVVLGNNILFGNIILYKTMSDEYTYYSSQTEDKNDFIFSNVQTNYITDNNNGAYPQGSVVFDLSTLSNSGKYIDFQNSSIVIPLVMNCNLTTTKTAPDYENAFMASLKNGYHQLVNSMSVEVSNMQTVNLTSMSNLDINFRLLTTSSLEDERNFLPSIGFHKDTAESIYYTDAVSMEGLGECNNKLKNTTFTSLGNWGSSVWDGNRGRLERQMNTSFDPINGRGGSAGTNLTTAAVANESGKNHVVFNGAKDITYNILATIPLKILHDFFKKLHLTKGMYMRLVLNLNTQCSTSVVLAPNGTTAANIEYKSFTTISLNNVFPCMLSPTGQTNGFDADGVTGVKLTLGIGKSFDTATTYSHPAMTSCRFYARVCEMTPQAEELYLSAVPSKRILYNDILSFSTLNQAAGTTVSQILTNGISRPRYLLIIPQMAGTINGSKRDSLLSQFAAGLPAALGSPMNSPFSSSPATTGFQAVISNLNVLVSGQTIYQQNYQYGFEEFLNEVRGCNSLNGGIPLALSSGLLSQTEWDNGYRVCVVDLSRRISQSNDDTSRSIQVSFKNAASYACDFQYILSYQKEVVISTSTGALII